MEKTTCEVADSVKSFKCQREEQCDDCFMVDHLKECSGCEHYEHGKKTMKTLLKTKVSAFEGLCLLACIVGVYQIIIIEIAMRSNF